MRRVGGAWRMAASVLLVLTVAAAGAGASGALPVPALESDGVASAAGRPYDDGVGGRAALTPVPLRGAHPPQILRSPGRVFLRNGTAGAVGGYAVLRLTPLDPATGLPAAAAAPRVVLHDVAHLEHMGIIAGDGLWLVEAAYAPPPRPDTPAAWDSSTGRGPIAAVVIDVRRPCGTPTTAPLPLEVAARRGGRVASFTVHDALYHTDITLNASITAADDAGSPAVAADVYYAVTTTEAPIANATAFRVFNASAPPVLTDTVYVHYFCAGSAAAPSVLHTALYRREAAGVPVAAVSVVTAVLVFMGIAWAVVCVRWGGAVYNKPAQRLGGGEGRSETGSPPAAPTNVVSGLSGGVHRLPSPRRCHRRFVKMKRYTATDKLAWASLHLLYVALLWGVAVFLAVDLARGGTLKPWRVVFALVFAAELVAGVLAIRSIAAEPDPAAPPPDYEETVATHPLAQSPVRFASLRPMGGTLSAAVLEAGRRPAGTADGSDVVRPTPMQLPVSTADAAAAVDAGAPSPRRPGLRGGGVADTWVDPHRGSRNAVRGDFGDAGNAPQPDIAVLGEEEPDATDHTHGSGAPRWPWLVGVGAGGARDIYCTATAAATGDHPSPLWAQAAPPVAGLPVDAVWAARAGASAPPAEASPANDEASRPPPHPPAGGGSDTRVQVRGVYVGGIRKPYTVAPPDERPLRDHKARMRYFLAIFLCVFVHVAFSACYIYLALEADRSDPLVAPAPLAARVTPAYLFQHVAAVLALCNVGALVFSQFFAYRWGDEGEGGAKEAGTPAEDTAALRLYAGDGDGDGGCPPLTAHITHEWCPAVHDDHASPQAATAPPAGARLLYGGSTGAIEDIDAYESCGSPAVQSPATRDEYMTRSPDYAAYAGGLGELSPLRACPHSYPHPYPYPFTETHDVCTSPSASRFGSPRVCGGARGWEARAVVEGTGTLEGWGVFYHTEARHTRGAGGEGEGVDAVPVRSPSRTPLRQPPSRVSLLSMRSGRSDMSKSLENIRQRSMTRLASESSTSPHRSHRGHDAARCGTVVHAAHNPLDDDAAPADPPASPHTYVSLVNSDPSDLPPACTSPLNARADGPHSPRGVVLPRGLQRRSPVGRAADQPHPSFEAAIRRLSPQRASTRSPPAPPNVFATLRRTASPQRTVQRSPVDEPHPSYEAIAGRRSPSRSGGRGRGRGRGVGSPALQAAMLVERVSSVPSLASSVLRRRVGSAGRGTRTPRGSPAEGAALPSFATVTTMDLPRSAGGSGTAAVPPPPQSPVEEGLAAEEPQPLYGSVAAPTPEPEPEPEAVDRRRSSGVERMSRIAGAVPAAVPTMWEQVGSIQAADAPVVVETDGSDTAPPTAGATETAQPTGDAATSASSVAESAPTVDDEGLMEILRKQVLLAEDVAVLRHLKAQGEQNRLKRRSSAASRDGVAAAAVLALSANGSGKEARKKSAKAKAPQHDIASWISCDPEAEPPTHPDFVPPAFAAPATAAPAAPSSDPFAPPPPPAVKAPPVCAPRFATTAATPQRQRVGPLPNVPATPMVQQTAGRPLAAAGGVLDTVICTPMVDEQVQAAVHTRSPSVRTTATTTMWSPAERVVRGTRVVAPSLPRMGVAVGSPPPVPPPPPPPMGADAERLYTLTADVAVDAKVVEALEAVDPLPAQAATAVAVVSEPPPAPGTPPSPDDAGEAPAGNVEPTAEPNVVAPAVDTAADAAPSSIPVPSTHTASDCSEVQAAGSSDPPAAVSIAAPDQRAVSVEGDVASTPQARPASPTPLDTLLICSPTPVPPDARAVRNPIAALPTSPLRARPAHEPVVMRTPAADSDCSPTALPVMQRQILTPAQDAGGVAARVLTPPACGPMRGDGSTSSSSPLPSPHSHMDAAHGFVGTPPSPRTPESAPRSPCTPPGGGGSPAEVPREPAPAVAAPPSPAKSALDDVLGTLRTELQEGLGRPYARRDELDDLRQQAARTQAALVEVQALMLRGASPEARAPSTQPAIDDLVAQHRATQAAIADMQKQLQSPRSPSEQDATQQRKMWDAVDHLKRHQRRTERALQALQAGMAAVDRKKDSVSRRSQERMEQLRVQVLKDTEMRADALGQEVADKLRGVEGTQRAAAETRAALDALQSDVQRRREAEEARAARLESDLRRANTQRDALEEQVEQLRMQVAGLSPARAVTMADSQAMTAAGPPRLASVDAPPAVLPRIEIELPYEKVDDAVLSKQTSPVGENSPWGGTLTPQSTFLLRSGDERLDTASTAWSRQEPRGVALPPALQLTGGGPAGHNKHPSQPQASVATQPGMGSTTYALAAADDPTTATDLATESLAGGDGDNDATPAAEEGAAARPRRRSLSDKIQDEVEQANRRLSEGGRFGGLFGNSRRAVGARGKAARAKQKPPQPIVMPQVHAHAQLDATMPQLDVAGTPESPRTPKEADDAAEEPASEARAAPPNSASPQPRDGSVPAAAPAAGTVVRSASVEPTVPPDAEDRSQSRSGDASAGGGDAAAPAPDVASPTTPRVGVAGSPGFGEGGAGGDVATARAAWDVQVTKSPPPTPLGRRRESFGGGEPQIAPLPRDDTASERGGQGVERERDAAGGSPATSLGRGRRLSLKLPVVRSHSPQPGGGDAGSGGSPSRSRSGSIASNVASPVAPPGGWKKLLSTSDSFRAHSPVNSLRKDSVQSPVSPWAILSTVNAKAEINRAYAGMVHSRSSSPGPIDVQLHAPNNTPLLGPHHRDGGFDERVQDEMLGAMQFGRTTTLMTVGESAGSEASVVRTPDQALAALDPQPRPEDGRRARRGSAASVTSGPERGAMPAMTPAPTLKNIMQMRNLAPRRGSIVSARSSSTRRGSMRSTQAE